MSDKLVNPFNDIGYLPLPENDPYTKYGKQSFMELEEMAIGFGAQVLRADYQGLWLGAKKFINAPFSVDMAGNVVANSLSMTGGTIKYGKTSFSDSANAGYFIGADGIYFGSVADATKLKYSISAGTFDFIGTISSRSTATLAAAINSGGNLITDLINARLDSSAKTILSDFNFGATNYAGAVKAGDIAWNATTGAITGGSGVVVYRKGIVGANAGVVTFSIDATTGNATFSGTITGSTITGGTIQTSDLTTVNRIRILGSSNQIQFLNSVNDNVAQIQTFYNGTDEGCTIQATGASLNTYYTSSSGYSSIDITANGAYFSASGKGTIAFAIMGLEYDVNNYANLSLDFSASDMSTAAITPTKVVAGSSVDLPWAGNFVPDSTTTYKLGTSSKVWLEGYINKILGLGTSNVIDLGLSGRIATNQDFVPSAAAGNNLGNATYYWNDVSYKTLTDRGCLGWFDEGVELQDGRIVSDIQAIKEVKQHPIKKTIYGKPMLDYKSLPKVVYKKAELNGKILDRDENDEPYIMENGQKIPAQDGAETTALISIMFGAIKELSIEIENLKKFIKQ